jgi:hypothetical protein
VVIKKKIFKDFQFFNQSKSIAAILDVGKGDDTDFESYWKDVTPVMHNYITYFFS